LHLHQVGLGAQRFPGRAARERRDDERGRVTVDRAGAPRIRDAGPGERVARIEGDCALVVVDCPLGRHGRVLQPERAAAHVEVVRGGIPGLATLD